MRFTAKDVAFVSVTAALLIAGQLALASISGVEIVTVLLLCFSYSFGISKGMVTATAFSLLRCLIWGFYPTVIILYLLYYNVFAFIFGAMGARYRKTGAESGVCGILIIELIFLLLFFLCICLLSGRIKVSSLLLDGLKILAFLILLVSVSGFAVYNFLLIFSVKFPALADVKRIIAVTAVAAVCTACFSLLDDVITPLFYGYTAEAVVAYFYASFVAMIPQVLCTVITVSILFLPLTKIFFRLAKK